MNKEELYIITDNSREQLDLLSPSGITLKWVSNLFNDISKLTCSYSYTFKLPMTANNRRVLELADDIRHNNMMMKKSFRAEFIINGICLCPNANLYISEMTDSFSCVMTWKVLKGFETLKNDGSKLNELPSMGKIQWGGDEQYGGTDNSTSNMDSVVYPDYDAGVPHMTNTPPKPCVPVYRLVQMINENFGVKFDIGQFMQNGMGMKPRRFLNNANYYGRRVYDDFVSNGVIPLVNSQISNDRFFIRGVFSIGYHNMAYSYLMAVENWRMATFGSGSTSNPKYTKFYDITSGSYTALAPVSSPQLNAEYHAPEVLAVGIPVMVEFRGNDYVKPMYAFQHNYGLSFFEQKKGQKADVDWSISQGAVPEWGERVYEVEERILDSFGTTPQKAWSRGTVRCTKNTTGVWVYSYDDNFDRGKEVGVVGFVTRNAFSIKGECDLRIAKSAVTAGRASIGSYKWICLAAVNMKKKDDTEEYEFSIEPVTEKSINSAAGFQSIDVPTYDEATDSYICHFEFGSEYDVRKIEVDGNDDEDFKGYVFLPYFPEDHTIDVEVTDEDGNTETVQRLNLQDGDFVIENLVITEIAPDIDVSVLPTSMRITESLPEISCFDFMKSVFYMNGAMPRVERDGETITAMYYNQLRDRVNDGDVIDWSDKILSADKDLAKSSQFHNTKFSKNNFFEMSKSNRDKTEEEVLSEFDQYGDGYGNIPIDDDTLKDELSVFKSSFAPAFIQNLRYPLVKVGHTCKVWEGDDVLVSNVPAIYGYMVYRTLDPKFEDTRVRRPQNGDTTAMHKRMNIFSPFDDEEMMGNMFGYLKAIMNDYHLVKEKFQLDEIELRDFDESRPVYLSKYNAYFAVSSIQRDKNGVSTVELIRLPREYDAINEIDNSYSVEMLSTGSVEAKSTTASTGNKVYIKRTKTSPWEETTTCVLNFGTDDIYAVAGESGKSLYVYCNAVGKYRFSYHDADTDTDKDFIKSEANVLFDGKQWSDCVATGYNGQKLGYVEIKDADIAWHKVEISIPIRNQFDEVVETRRWSSSILVSNKEALEGYDVQGKKTVVTCNALGSLHVDLIRDYTSNQTAIETNLGRGAWNGDQSIGYDNPIWALPYEGTRLKGDSYSLRIDVYKSVSYTVSKYKDGVLLSKDTLSANVRVYYDDQRVPESVTKTLYRSEFGKWHTLKYEFNIVDKDGTLIEQVHRRVIWFVSTKVQSAIDSPYGTTHDGDANLKVNDVAVTGSSSISDTNEHAYTFKFLPEYADVKAQSVKVTVSNTATAALELVSQSIEGFSVRATKLPTDESDVIVNIEVTLADGSKFTKQKPIALSTPYVHISGTLDFEANNGKGSKTYYVYIMPNSMSSDRLVSVISSNPLIEVTSVNATSRNFTLTSSSISTDETSQVTVVCERDGVQYSKTFTIKAVFKSVWSTDLLDSEGALIVDRNGMFYTADDWRIAGIEATDADGIAVSDGTHRFIVAKKDVGSLPWGSTSILVSGIKTTTSADDAHTDFNGKANTDAIIAQDSNASAAIQSYAVGNFPSGKHGYLPAAGEWKVYMKFCTKIESLMNAIGGSVIQIQVTGVEDRYTSTQRNQSSAWYFHFGTDNVVRDNGKSVAYLVRPFAELTMLTNPIMRGSLSISGSDSFTVTNGKGSARYAIAYGPNGVNVEEMTATSSNPDVKVRVISNSLVELYVDKATIDEVTTLTVKARLNGLMETATKTVTAIGETVVDFAKLDAAHALIIDKDYNLYDEDEWYASHKIITDVNGIAVSDGTHRLVIAIKDYGSGKYYWGGRNISIPGLSSGYAGKENTDKIIEAVTRSDGYFKDQPYSAAGVARSFIFPNGEAGYLGSNSDWQLVLNYLDEIEALLAAVGGDSLIKTYSYTYWSSYSGDEIRAYCVHCYLSSYDNTVHKGLESYRYRSDMATIRPFHNF